jgi:hypothetical protein
MQSSPLVPPGKKHDRYEHKETIPHDNTSCTEGENSLTKDLHWATIDPPPPCEQHTQLHEEGTVRKTENDLVDAPFAVTPRKAIEFNETLGFI